MLLFSTNVILMEIEVLNISSSPTPAKSPSNFIRYNCQNICSYLRRPKTSDITLFWVIKKSIIYKFFKGFTNHWKKTNRMVVFGCRTFSNILKYRDHQWDFPRIWKTRLIQTTYWRIQLVYTKVQVHSSLGPPMECNQDQIRHIKVCYELFNNLGSYRNI